MVKAIILDIDGVIVGDKIGINSPWPHSDVIKTLKNIREKGISISLCTAKPYFAISKIIKDARLNNPHITEGGAVIINPIDHLVIQKHIIDNNIAANIIKVYLENNIYTEFYTLDDYFIQQNQYSEITNKHIHILQRKPIIVESLLKKALGLEIVKIMPIARGETEQNKIKQTFKPFSKYLTLSWGVHPVALPLQFGIITTVGISKRQGASAVAKSLGVSFENILGIGDSLSDWEFIEPCQYGAAMGNASLALKELVLSKGEKFSYIGPTVDENGILEILSHFNCD